MPDTPTPLPPGAVLEPLAQDEARQRALALLRRHGWNATSFQCLEPGFRYWFDREVEACVAYADTGSAWVAAGAPISAPEHLRTVSERFVTAALAAGRRICFFATERRFLQATGFRALLIGEQPIWDPTSWDDTLRESRSLREQLRRARAKDVVVRRLEPEELTRAESSPRREVDRLIDRWLRSRRLPPMGFLVQVYPYSFAEERRFFVAEQGGRVVAFLAMVPVYARNGWLLDDLLREPASPNGTAELLIDAAMRTAAEEGSEYVTLGLAPLAGRVSGWLRAARRLGARLYNFEGLHAFKSRLRPHRWEPIYVAYPPGQGEWLTVYDALTAFARGGLLRFGLLSLIHSPDIGIRALTVLLVPWTLLLASAESERWFPAPWVQWAWTAFDLLLFAGLLALCLRWRQRLAVLLATLITGDALLTLIEVLVFNFQRVHTALEWGVLILAVCGPTAAAALLWTAVTHQARLETP